MTKLRKVQSGVLANILTFATKMLSTWTDAKHPGTVAKGGPYEDAVVRALALLIDSDLSWWLNDSTRGRPGFELLNPG